MRRKEVVLELESVVNGSTPRRGTWLEISDLGIPLLLRNRYQVLHYETLSFLLEGAELSAPDKHAIRCLNRNGLLHILRLCFNLGEIGLQCG